MPVKYKPEDRQRMKAMKAAGMKLREIGDVFGLKVSQVHNIVSPKVSPRNQSWMLRIVGVLGEGTVIPPPYAIDEAIARAEYPRTPTQFICGDPVLNQCALYRAQHGERL